MTGPKAAQGHTNDPPTAAQHLHTASERTRTPAARSIPQPATQIHDQPQPADTLRTARLTPAT